MTYWKFILLAFPAFLNSGPAFAQTNYEACDKAKKKLAELKDSSGRYASHQSFLDHQRQQDYYFKIWDSDRCKNYRKPRELNVDEKIRQNRELVELEGFSFAAALPEMRRSCVKRVETRWQSATQKFRRQQKKSELIESCVTNLRDAKMLELLHIRNKKVAISNARNVAKDKKNISQYNSDIDEYHEKAQRNKAEFMAICDRWGRTNEISPDVVWSQCKSNYVPPKKLSKFKRSHK